MPRTGEPVKTHKPAPPSREALKGNETVLLAEDDETVRTLAGRILEKYGYRVLEAGDGSAAIRICRRYPGPIHLLITDVVMPEMNGLELFGRLSELRDDLKVLYISGYTDSAVAPFVQKPFTPESLAMAAREVLGSIQ